MGLDIYVGPLTRYYSGEWETIIQQAGREMGVPVAIQRSPGFLGFPPISEVHDAVLAWRTALEAAIHDLTNDLLDWAELPDGDYATDKPDYDGIEAVRQLAAQLEFPSVPLPARAGRDGQFSHLLDFVRDRYSLSLLGRVRKLIGRPGPRPKGPFEQLHFASLWLPIDAEITFETKDIGGNIVRIGSVPRLRQQLERLNERTFNGDRIQLEAWRRENSPDDQEFRGTARFGLAVWLQLAIEADERRQPLILDG